MAGAQKGNGTCRYSLRVWDVGGVHVPQGAKMPDLVRDLKGDGWSVFVYPSLRGGYFALITKGSTIKSTDNYDTKEEAREAGCLLMAEIEEDVNA